MQDVSFVIVDENTIISAPESISAQVRHALDMIVRDHKKVFGKEPEMKCSQNENPDI